MGSAGLTYQELPPMNAWATPANNHNDNHQQQTISLHAQQQDQHIHHLSVPSTAFMLAEPLQSHYSAGDQQMWSACQSIQPDGNMQHDVRGAYPQKTVQVDRWYDMASVEMTKRPNAMPYRDQVYVREYNDGMRTIEPRYKKRSNGYRLHNSATNSSSPEELCLVCGDKASGYHYNALTCEGCKGFFRRSITRKALYYCKYGGHCDIDMYMRRKCQACRLRKCLDVGMRPELVIPEEQCRIKRESKGRKKNTKTTAEEAVVNSPQQVTSTESLSPIPKTSNMSPEQQELLHRVMLCQEKFDVPSNEDLMELSTTPSNCPNQAGNFQHLAELTILNMKLIYEFIKNLPGFWTLLPEDQNLLIKSSSAEVLMLKTARRYDPKLDTIVLGNSHTSWSYNRKSYRQAGWGSTTDNIFEFSKSIAKMRVDNAEYALLTAISVFSEKPKLLEPRKVEDIQEVYTSTLQAYVEIHRPKNRNMFARLLMKLTDLRTLGSEHADALFSLRLEQTMAGVEHDHISLIAPDGKSLSTVRNIQMTSRTRTKSSPSLAGINELATNCYRVPNVRIKVEPLDGRLADNQTLKVGPNGYTNVETPRDHYFASAQPANNLYKMPGNAEAAHENDLLHEAVSSTLGPMLKREQLHPLENEICNS